jgi:Leucine-rich repeat (LRR) protein
MLLDSVEHEDIRNAGDLLDESIAIEKVQRRMLEANTVNLVVVDACAVASSLLLPELHVGGMQSPMQMPATLLVLADAIGPTQVGRISASIRDTSEARNSPVAASILQSLRNPSITFEQLSRNVKVDVGTASRMKQQPLVISTLLPDVHFSQDRIVAELSANGQVKVLQEEKSIASSQKEIPQPVKETTEKQSERKLEEEAKPNEVKAKQEAEEKAKQEAEAKAKQEAEAKAKQEAEAKAKQEAEEKAKQEAEAKAKQDAEDEARLEAEGQAKQKEAEETEKKEAEAAAKQEAEEKAAAEIRESFESEDRVSLVTFFNELSGQEWKSSRNWLSTQPISMWEGITIGKLEEKEVVIRIDLPGMGLKGALPEVIGSFTGLQQLNLGTNTITGKLPAALGKLGSLKQLDLHANKISGGFPSELATMGSLEVAKLHDNLLEGSGCGNVVMTAPGPELIDAGCQGQYSAVDGGHAGRRAYHQKAEDFENFMYFLPEYGTWSVGEELGSSETFMFTASDAEAVYDVTQTWKVADGDGNWPEVNGVAIKCTGSPFGGLMQLPKVSRLHLENNRIAGSIPEEIGGCTALTHLHLHGNKLSGALPEGLTKLRGLQYINVQTNQITEAEKTRESMMAKGISLEFHF